MITLSEAEKLIKNNPPYKIKNNIYSDINYIQKAQKFEEEHGFNFEDTWNLDYSIACFVLPRLCYYRDNIESVPCSTYNTHSIVTDIDNMEINKWKNILNKMIEAFYFTIIFDKDLDSETINNEDKYNSIMNERSVKIKDGLKLFAEYFNDLWD